MCVRSPGLVVELLRLTEAFGRLFGRWRACSHGLRRLFLNVGSQSARPRAREYAIAQRVLGVTDDWHPLACWHSSS